MAQVPFADLIVVGAGSAGSVIANRASERGNQRVCLIEAGPDYEGLHALPSDLQDGRKNSMFAHDWGLTHYPTQGRVIFDFPRGKVMGGSSAVNTCIALRGQPRDYDEWAALGLPEWSFERCLPAFKRLETDLDFSDEWHGQEGPVPIRRHKPDELVPWQSAFLEAAKELSFPECVDHNRPDAGGYGAHPMNKVDGIRMSAARCYLTPEVRARESLWTLPNTLVRRVLFRNKRAYGVEIENRHGEISVIETTRVVLCGGAIATPGVLLRSGIGPAHVLARLGITPVSELSAVGARLLDHPGSVMVLAPRPAISELGHPLIQTVLRYTSEGSQYPFDMQLQPGSLLPLPYMSFPLVTIMCSVGKPRAHGRLEFTSADPHEKPKIYSNFAQDARDVKRAAEALELGWLLARRKPMQELARCLWPSEAILSNRQRLCEWLPSSSGSGYHPCGTVPMGPEGQRDAAVDERGRVRGVSGLHVADASIMPTIPSYNINLPSLMIGERFGEWLSERALD